jgi:hypothetical protein
VNIIEARDANPFFHVMEACAMLANMNSVTFMTFFNKNMRMFSDDGETYNAFYGTRMLDFPIDQLAACIVQLRADNHTRAAVIQIWQVLDLVTSSVDRACNLSLVFNTRPNGELDMTIFNRSNDLVWGGVSGANIVHMSMFHEIVARGADIPMGKMYVISNDAHVYLDNEVWIRLCKAEEEILYANTEFYKVPVGQNYAVFMSEMFALINAIMDGKFPIVLGDNFEDPFICTVVIPMYNAWVHRKRKQPEAMWEEVRLIADDHWQFSCANWIRRRDDASKESA